MFYYFLCHIDVANSISSNRCRFFANRSRYIYIFTLKLRHTGVMASQIRVDSALFQIMTDWLVKVRFTGFCEGSGWITYKFLIGKFNKAEIVSIAWHHHYLYPSRMVFKWGRFNRINIVMRHSWIVDITGSLPNTIHDIGQSWHQDINVNGGAPHTIIYGDL